MTKKTPENTDKTVSTQSSSNQSEKPAVKTVATNADPKSTAVKKSGSVLQIILLALVIVLFVGLWYQYQRSNQISANLLQQIQAESGQAQQALQLAKSTTDKLNQQNQKIITLKRELEQSKSELDGLNKAFQLVTDRGSDLVLLNDIEHMVTIAQQQLQLGGNVANAIISLEAAQARLARANRPSLASLQQTINGDLDRLRAASTVDIALLSARLDELAGLVLQAPLLVPDLAVPESNTLKLSQNSLGSSVDQSSAGAESITSDQDLTNQNWWKKTIDTTRSWSVSAALALKHDLGQFVSVRRVDDATALLISPDQATRFRDNLRLRIMTSQLALMMGQAEVWETETSSVLHAIESRFDQQSGLTRKAIRIAREVTDTSIVVSLPTVNNTIKALEALHEEDAAEKSELSDSQAE